MTMDARIFYVILTINTIAAISYEVWNETHWRENPGARTGGRIRTLVMLLTPIVGPVFFLMGTLVQLILFRQEVDLEDVIFSKERVQTRQMADADAEGNIVPIEEALAVSDKDSMRTLLMNIIKGDVQDSLASIALALNSEDSETSHYAATVLRDALNDFRAHVQELYNKMQQEGLDASPYAVELITYMNRVLVQDVFHEAEQRSFVDMMEEACTLLYEKFWRELRAEHIQWLCSLLLSLGEYDRMKVWCDRSREFFPDELSTYTNYLKLYFTTGQKKEFFTELDRLKASRVVIDRETLDLIRTFT